LVGTGAGAASSGNVILAAASSIGVATATDKLDLGGVVSGAQDLTKLGAGDLTLSGSAANTYSGVTYVSAGNLLLNKTAGLNAIVGDGNSSKTTADVVVSGGTLKLLANEQLDNSVFLSLTGGTFNRNGKTETIYHFTNSGGTYTSGRGGGLIVTDPDWTGGTNHILGADVHGNLTISGGTNIIHGDESSAAGGASLTVGGLSPHLQFYGAGSPNLTISSDDVSAGKLILAGDVSTAVGFTGTASITNGNKLQDNGNDTWTDLGSVGSHHGQIDLNGANRTFTVANSAATLSISAQIVGSGVGIVKQGAGTLNLTNVNTYNGATSVNAGTLQGTGTIAGTVDIGSGATLSPGFAAVGTLTVQSLTTFDGGTLQVSLPGGTGRTAGVDYSLLTTNGLTIAGTSTLDLTVGSFTSAANDYIWIVNNTSGNGISGTFANINNLPSGYNIYYGAQYGNNTVGGLSGGNDVVITNVPEPTTVAMFGSAGAAGLIAFIRYRRRREKQRAQYFRECSYHQYFGYHVDPYELETQRVKSWRKAKKIQRRRGQK